MENVVLTIGGLLKTLEISDLFFFITTLILILLLVYIIYIIRDEEINDEVLPPLKEEKKPSKLEDIVNKLETEYDPKPIDLSSYEEAQEKEAVISYEELVKKATNNISYEDEYSSGFNDLTIKKVDLTNTSNTQELVNLPKAVMMKYDNEEAFLKTLNSLQSNLVR